MRAARTRGRMLAAAGAVLAVAGLVTGCTAGTESTNSGPTNNANNTETGETVRIGFSGPAADHGWLGAINSAAIAEAEKYDDVELIVAEIAGIDSLPLTQDRSRGFADALDDCGLEVSNRVAADFTVQGGEAAASQLLSAAPQIDAIWNHDDDQGVGVLAAIDAAGRDEFFMVGGAGSKNAMEAIKSGDSVLEATVIYPSTQGADGIALARLVAQGKALGDLVEQDVPTRIVLFAPVVTADNVDTYLPTAFTS